MYQRLKRMNIKIIWLQIGFFSPITVILPFGFRVRWWQSCPPSSSALRRCRGARVRP